MTKSELTPADLRQLEQEGLTREDVTSQLEKFRFGTTPVTLLKPCTPGDGIEDLSETEKAECIARYETAAPSLDILKFVPASGAATRMFKDWFKTIDENDDQDGVLARFAAGAYDYAFSADLEAILHEHGIDLRQWLALGRIREAMAAVLLEHGLNYGRLPKALLRFHRYGDRSRTALEEHLVEAAGYARSGGNLCRLHFTVSPEFIDPVRRHVGDVAEAYASEFGVRYDITLSVQSPATNTIAVDPDNRLFRDERGCLVLRPGGHGALLYNLNALEADLIFIKNIDNVAHDRFKEPSYAARKALAGFLLIRRERIFRYLEALARANAAARTLSEISDFCRDILHMTLPDGYRTLSAGEKRTFLQDRLDRPIRVCGMVRNTGEPGGGPFWVRERNGDITRQIIEQFQVNEESPGQQAIWSSSTHFNPVDLVCATRNWQGGKFDLSAFADQNAVCISRKTEKGRALKALELPGLWNGSMARWITLFVEMPLITFNPVKSVEDLLRREHQPE